MAEGGDSAYQQAGGDDNGAGGRAERGRGRQYLHNGASRVRARGKVIGFSFAWGAPWAALGWAALEGNTSYAPVIAGVALFFLACNLAAFLYVLFSPTLWASNLWSLGAAFVLTFVAVVAAYAAADYAASHSEVTRHGKPVIAQHEAIRDGKRVMVHDGPMLDPCYVEPSPSGTLRPTKLSLGEAMYVGVGTLTTIGWGDIAARSSCRVMTAGELAIGFPMVSLAIAGLAAALFREVL